MLRRLAAPLTVLLALSPASAQVRDVVPIVVNAAPAPIIAPAAIAPLGATALIPSLAASALEPLAPSLLLSAPTPAAAPALAPALAPAALPALLPAASILSPDEPAQTGKTSPDPATPPAIRVPAATRWLTQFIGGIEKALASSSRGKENLRDRADFETRADAAGEFPELRSSSPLSAEHSHEGWTRVVYFKDDKTIVTGGMDGALRVLEVASGRLLGRLDGHTGIIRALDMSPDRRYLFSADDAGALLRWDLTRPNEDPLVLQPAMGHAVRAFRLSPDGRFLATGEHDGTIAIWDAAAGRRLRSFDIGRTVYDLVYSCDGKRLLAAGSDGIIRRIDVKSGNVAEFAGHAKGVRAVAIRPEDGLLMSAAEDGTIRSWDVDTGRELGRYDVPDKWVRSLAFAPDGVHLYTGNINGRIDRLEVGADGRVAGGRTMYAHDDVVFQAAVSPSGDFLVSSGRDLRVGVLDADGRLSHLQGSGGPVHAMFLLRDGTPVGISHDGNLLVWENPESKPRRVRSHSQTARALAVTSGGTIATGGDDKIILMHVPKRDEPITLSGHVARVRALAFSPDQKLLASGGDDRTLWIWDARTGDKRFRVQLPAEVEVIHALAFSPDGKRIAIAGRDGLVRELDLRKRKLLPAWERRHQGYIRSLAYSPDGKVLATGGRDGSVWLWETRSGRPLRPLKGHSDDVNSLDFASRRFLVSASDDKTVRIWDTAGDRVTVYRGLRPFSTARFSRDGSRVLAIDDRETLTTFNAHDRPAEDR